MRKTKLYTARIIINDQANDGDFSKSFILKMLRMGAEICVNINEKSLFLEDKDDYREFVDA